MSYEAGQITETERISASLPAGGIAEPKKERKLSAHFYYLSYNSKFISQAHWDLKVMEALLLFLK